MKITQYFTSPSKEFMKNMVENSDTLKNSGNKNVNIEDKKENSTGDKSESMGTSKKQKRRKRRVPSDPIVKDVIALLSNKLTLVSPNSSVSEKSPVSFSQCVNTGENNEISSNIPIDNSEDQRKSEETVSRLSLLNVNAFQFMMNSRNNVIGQNSGGKEAPVEQSTSIEEKNKLASRKNLFKNWANQKGAMKRKRDEDEIECCINYKMGKRARRLKKMIQNNTQVEAEKLEVVKPQRKKVRRISSESESSNDGRLVSGCVPSQLGKTDLKGTDEECVKNSENNIKNDKVQNNLLNFVALKKNKGDVVVFDSDANTTNSTQTPIIKIKMFTRKSSKKKASKVTEPDKDELAINIDTNSPKFNLQSTSKLNLEDINDGSNSYPSSPRRSLRVHRKTLNYSEMDIKVSDTKSKKTKKSENMNSLNTSGIPNKLATVFMPRSSSENNVKINKTNIQEISDSESEGDSKKKLVKVAPLFLKANARPKLDKETIEARKQFLMSGIPESLKKTVEKQKSMEERVYNIFPSNSHIQQKCDNPYWNLSRPERSFLEDSELHVSKIDCTNLIKKETFSQPNFIMSGKLHNIKHHLDDIKTENPNYPVYKVFKYIYENSGYLIKKAAPKTSPRKKAKKENRLSTDEFTNVNENSTSKKYELWTEKYKPKTSEHILGNKKVVTSLKNWLETWMNYSKEINSRVKRLQEDANSESEFDFTDCDSRDSTRILSNTMILIGPCGSGKTSAVYTIANELGFNVLEVNSSSRRTGKKIIQELQEATQSHQVRKKGIIASSSQHEHIKIKEKRSKKMCILLVEDIDLVFEQDEGFLSSLYQLITTSKRPIILTTTDTTPLHVQKLLNQHECIVFRPIYKEILGVWLQIVCLVEGLLVDKNDISSLLDYYKGDVRKSLLSAQFWCQSGGQLNRDVFISFLTVPALPESSLLDTVDDDVKISPEQNYHMD
ncbi:hypothetical protein GWI33_008116 [Rhynchophorus ferrugineus]|uniref:ATPase AAA-type core domain-containing protein n=1 Tax=Rhynchophorus ferrugineus TaxID=354439 RepID=A0A834MBB6_RHYFE|nr:hypothetical protein GWI33_008116 [Rhynchophorus ferrugineus]